MQENYIHSGDWRTEFPDFPADAIPWLPGWTDKSWHNDVCPSFLRTFTVPDDAGESKWLAVLWGDWPDRSMRELPGSERFTLVLYDVTAGESAWDKYYSGEHDFQAYGETLEEVVEKLNDRFGLSLRTEGTMWFNIAVLESIKAYMEAQS